MPLAAAKPTLKAAILSTYMNLGSGRVYPTPAQKAQEISLAIYSTLLQGIPQTTVNGTAAMGQVVFGFVTTTPAPVTGSGTGGLDKSSPGKGLDTAKSDFISTMEATYTDREMTADKAADTLADAIIALYSEAKVMTNVTGMFAPGAAVPAPIGPVAPGPWSGTGKGGIEGTAGTGLVSANLAKDLEEIFKTFPKSHNEGATKWADALIKFAKTASVTTIDQGTAGGGSAAVMPPAPPLPGGNGTTLAPSPLIGSTGTGFLV